jgi:D-galactonate transporter
MPMNPIETLYGRVGRRLVPFLFLCYVVAYLDRVNVGFAKLQMQADLGLSETVYGLGAGIFFIGYFLFEVPANLLMTRVGARRWIARIMASWGVVSAAMMFTTSTHSFYVLRFLLGAAEAGFFPGVILYLTYWYPARRRARIVAIFMSAIAVAGVLGGPMSGAIMSGLAGVSGLKGWQWLFLLEGLPSIVVGVWALWYLDDSIDDAMWLDDEQKAMLKQELAADNEAPRTQWPLRHVFGSSRVWMLALIYFLFVMGLYGVSFWLPQLIRNSGVQDVLSVGLLTAIPYGIAAVVMIASARHSDRTGERRWHAAIAAFAGAAGLAITSHTNDPLTSMMALSLATAGILSTFPVFWSLPTSMLGGTAAAAGIAIVNSVGNLAGFLSPYMVGAIKDATHSTTQGMMVLAASLLAGGVLVLLCVNRRNEVL